MAMSDRRQDGKTATLILETLHMKRAFDEDAAMKLLRKELVPDGPCARGAGWAV
ncbi:hypothetical protein INH39_28480 [Massilia violaceinigra]|uniref:Transposase n=1 Tax=Massilia violaceinigra TaxID=2045208 RepID=A0ABY4A5M3_9BURK|nr:hypothetical protein [Massilia violaceinigra]UOD29304.1 hypothetical protein INH39_28480 [Massilia violaceinigra]